MVEFQPTHYGQCQECQAVGEVYLFPYTSPIMQTEVIPLCAKHWIEAPLHQPLCCRYPYGHHPLCPEAETAPEGECGMSWLAQSLQALAIATPLAAAGLVIWIYYL